MDCVSYLQKCISQKKLGRPSVAVVLLKKLSDDQIEDAVNDCRNILLNSFRKKKIVKLAALIASMGRATSLYCPVEVDDGDSKRLGAQMFEAFMNGEECIRIERQFKRTKKVDGKWQDNPYVVYPTDAFLDMFKHIKPTFTTTQPIAPITELRQSNGSSVIKHWGRDKEEEFKTYLDRPFVKACDSLQSTSWQINEAVLDAILSNHLDKLIPEDLPNLKKLTGAKKLIAQSLCSKVAANKVILEKAKELRGKLYYQYVDFDWRGRLYYKESFLSFQGMDLARGLMKFGTAKPLGEVGLRWLAIHTANSFNQSYDLDDLPDWITEDYATEYRSKGLTNISVDKMNLADRVSWTMDNMENILLTAELGGLPDCEKPVSYLACCLEYKAIQGMDNPEWHFCALPISVDGSNNGWQHLGAMLKDELTGSLVGMVPSPAPNDLYVAVAQQMVASNPEFFDSRNMPMKSIRKAIAKRGTMTRAYSAGPGAIAENMWNDVVQAGYDSKYDIQEDHCNVLAKSLIKAIEAVCPKPMEAMDFLQKSAGHMIDQGHDCIRWTSPSGFPVEQRYMIQQDNPLDITFGVPKGIYGVGFTGKVQLVYKEDTPFPNRKDHFKSISPNFVHSQDAAHLAITIAEWDGPFGAVHDSFSAHACDIEDLLVLIKEVFIEMYESEDFLGELARNLGVPDNSPATGDLDINEIMNCDFFFA